MYYIGLMSGTSADAIDTVLAWIDDHAINILQYHQFPIPDPTRAAILAIDSHTPLLAVSELDVELGTLFAGAISDLLKTADIDAKQVHAIGSHGQTVLHLPFDTHPRTLQIGDPARIAVLTGITTVADFRRTDIAAGGQGAPLACGFHAWRFRSISTDRVVLNLGGMANITVLPADPLAAVTGFDTGPANALMDGWIRRQLGRDYDRDGEWAASGRCDETLLAALLADPYFSTAPPKSTGRDDFNPAWLAARLNANGGTISPVDVQATLLELTARSISEAVAAHAPQTREVLVCGGGVRNRALMQRLAVLLPQQMVESTNRHGVDADAVEAITFAWLARCRLENRPANLPSVTGAARPVILGAIYGA